MDTQISRYEGMIHGFNVQVGFIDAAAEALDEAAERLQGSILLGAGDGA